jgi:hypothetical protein
MMSMLDFFSGYHQIWMKKSDEDKTSITTPFSTYCFIRMLEGPKNAECSFKRIVKVVLGTQLDRNALAYVDDVVMRS